ncbi:late nodulin [Medicago truncatula]|uniref:Late nodulin n=1 Tax=Medicago truncatula TaxID=3880 RepID=G7L295_MEDTR|nr:late nodulin [Medicago truncatula]
MAETLKIVYIVILLGFLCLVVVDGISVLGYVITSDCYTTFMFAPERLYKCVKGYCYEVRERLL